MQLAIPAKSFANGFRIVALGLLVAAVTVVALAHLRPIYLAIAFGGIIIALPTLVIREQKAYWLFMFVLSMSVDVRKRTTEWLVNPLDLLDLAGPGTISLDVYLTDVVLVALLLPWLARVALRLESFYFPKFAYLYVLYLAWALIPSVIAAESHYRAIFEWLRQIIYFLYFIYLINNVRTLVHIRTILLALFIGLASHSAIVITFFQLGIGTETDVFSSLYRKRDVPNKDEGPLVLHQSQSGQGSSVARSTGAFSHPALAAYYFEYILPIVLAFLFAVGRIWPRILLAMLFGLGVLATFVTFSRSGLLGLIGGSGVVFVLVRWFRLISLTTFARCVFVLMVPAAVIVPIVINSILSRPEATSVRMELIELALNVYWQNPMIPILGTGLDNSPAMMQNQRDLMTTGTRDETRFLALHIHYLIVLTETGIIGFILFFTFFGQVVLTALRAIRASTERYKKALLIGIVGGLACISIHNLGDRYGGHINYSLLWLFVSLVVVIARQAAAERTQRVTARPTAIRAPTADAKSVRGAPEAIPNPNR